VVSYLGCQANFRDDTIWFGPPILNDWKCLSEVKFNPQNKLWKVTKELTDFLSRRGKNKFLTAFAELGGVMDIMASLRGSERLCLDLIEYPGISGLNLIEDMSFYLFFFIFNPDKFSIDLIIVNFSIVDL